VHQRARDGAALLLAARQLAGRWLMRPARPTSDSTSSARERAFRGAEPPISSGIMTFSNAENSRNK